MGTGTFDAQGSWNPSAPTGKDTAADVVHSLLWRRNASDAAGRGTSDDVLYEQIGQQMRRLLPQQAEVLDGVAGGAQDGGGVDTLLGSAGDSGFLGQMLMPQPQQQQQQGAPQAAAAA